MYFPGTFDVPLNFSKAPEAYWQRSHSTLEEINPRAILIVYVHRILQHLYTAITVSYNHILAGLSNVQDRQDLKGTIFKYLH